MRKFVQILVACTCINIALQSAYFERAASSGASGGGRSYAGGSYSGRRPQHYGGSYHQGSAEFVHDAEIMNRIIREFNLRGMVSPRKQEEFKRLLMKIQQYSDSFDPVKYNVKLFKKEYLNPYKMWAKHILAKPTHEQLELYKVNEEAEAIESQVKKVFADVDSSVDQALRVFTNTVHKMLEGLEGYSAQNKQDFYTELSGAVRTFENKMKSAHDKAFTDYLSFIRAHGENVDPTDLTPQQHAVARGIESIIEQGLLHVHALALDLTAQQASHDFENQILEELKKHEQEQTDEYNKILERNEQQSGKTWWDQLEKRGRSVLDKFVSQSTPAVKAAGEKAGKEFMEQHGSELQKEAESIKGEFGKLIPSGLKKN